MRAVERLVHREAPPSSAAGRSSRVCCETVCCPLLPAARPARCGCACRVAQIARRRSTGRPCAPPRLPSEGLMPHPSHRVLVSWQTCLGASWPPAGQWRASGSAVCALWHSASQEDEIASRDSQAPSLARARGQAGGPAPPRRSAHEPRTAQPQRWRQRRSVRHSRSAKRGFRV
jgi:hypothetical protein